MTALDPTISAFDRPDQLSGALQQQLPRPMNPKLTWGLIRTLLLSGITGGIVPTVFLPRRFANFAKAEQLQFWHLAEWLRLQTGDEQAAAATAAAGRVAPPIGWRLASLAFVIAAIAIACSALPHNGPIVPRWFGLTLPQLTVPDALTAPLPRRFPWHVDSHGDWHWRSNWQGDESTRYSRHQFDDPHVFEVPSGQGEWYHIYHPDNLHGQSVPDPYAGAGDNVTENSSGDSIAANAARLVRSNLNNAYALAMSAAALCWLIEINSHIGRVRKFILAFNQLSNRYGVGPVRPPGVHLGIRPFWILAAAAMCSLGGYWAAPVLLAASAHKRYINSTSRRIRSDLARRQREVLLAKRPAVRVPLSHYLTGTCPRENCRAPSPPEAVYCRRCGMKLGGNAE